MPDTRPQAYANHAKFDPPFHYFLTPVLLITLLMALWGLFRFPSLAAAWTLVLVLAAFVNTFLTRIYALRVQDRVIRLEERLRLQEVLPQALRSRTRELTEKQLVALRFAPDEELPGLVERTLAEAWTPKQIKQAIRDWRPDYFRV